MGKRKGVNSRKRYTRRKRKFISGLRRLLPGFCVGGGAAALLAGAMYSGVFSYGKLAAVIDRSRLFSINKIAVRGNNRVATEEVLKRCGIAPAVKTYQVKKSAVTAALLADPWIEKARCVTRWWGTVALEIKERTPIAFINYGEVCLVDRFGVLLPIEPGKTYGVPIITAPRTFAGGKGRRPDSTAIVRACRFVARIGETAPLFFVTVTQLDISDSGRIRCIAADRPLVIDLGYDADARQLRNAQYLLEALTKNPAVRTRIDLRYQNLAFVSREPPGFPPQRNLND